MTKPFTLAYSFSIIHLSTWGQDTREYYQLKTYLCDTRNRKKVTTKYLSESLLPALKKKLNIKTWRFKNQDHRRLNPTEKY